MRVALRYLDKTLEIDPKYADAWRSKGVILASHFWNENQLSASAVFTDAHVDFDRFSEAKDAIACFEKELEIKGIDTKGAALLMLGRHKESIACLEKTLVIDPKNGEAWLGKGFALSLLGRHEDAVACFDKVWEINPTDYEAKFLKNKSLEEINKKRQSRED
ncbi:MAG: tetratricopeptide repeat protein [Candidatus Brocadiaceae bacterium]